jgi:hypothetical protein
MNETAGEEFPVPRGSQALDDFSRTGETPARDDGSRQKAEPKRRFTVDD